MLAKKVRGLLDQGEAGPLRVQIDVRAGSGSGPSAQRRQSMAAFSQYAAPMLVAVRAGLGVGAAAEVCLHDQVRVLGGRLPPRYWAIRTSAVPGAPRRERSRSGRWRGRCCRGRCSGRLEQAVRRSRRRPRGPGPPARPPGGGHGAADGGEGQQVLGGCPRAIWSWQSQRQPPSGPGCITRSVPASFPVATR